MVTAETWHKLHLLPATAILWSWLVWGNVPTVYAQRTLSTSSPMAASSTWQHLTDSAAVALALRDTLQAFRLYDEAVCRWHDVADVHFKRAMANALVRRFDAAIHDLDNAMQRDTTATVYAGFLRRRAELCYAAKRYREAVRDIGIYLSCGYPDPAPLYLLRGTIAEALGDIEGAAMDYTEYIGLMPSDAEGYTARGKLFVLRGQLAEAKQDFDASLARDPDEGKVYYLRASVLIEQNHLQAAYNDLEQALRLGYKGALELIHRYCSSYIRRTTLDSLQTYFLPEVAVEGERYHAERARQEIKSIAERSTLLFRTFAARVAAPGSAQGQRAPSTGMGIASLGAQRPLLVSEGSMLNVDMTITKFHAMPPSKVTLDLVLDLLRDRVLVINNPAATTIMMRLTQRRNTLVMLSNTGAQAAPFIRETLDDIYTDIQKLSALLSE